MLAESRAVLIGVSDYDHPDEFPPIRAARNSLQAMRALLADPALCGWPPGQVTVIENPASATDLAEPGRRPGREHDRGAAAVLRRPRRAVPPRGTVPDRNLHPPSRPQFSSLLWDNVAEILRACPARARLVILDCCFAGQAIEALSGHGDPGLADIAHVQGVYTLTATTRNRTAHVPPPGQQDTACTSFTGELRDLIRSGITGKPPRLTFGDIYPVLHQRLLARGLPVPNQRGTDTAYQFPFTANAAARIGPHARSTRPAEGNGTGEAAHKNREPDRADRARATRILGDAERIAQSITFESWKVPALVRVAGAVAATDPDRAARLSADAERIAQSITDKDRKERALAAVAGAVAATDPDRAERIARSITARSITAQSITAQSITDTISKQRVLADVAGAMAATDPDRAERIAQSITTSWVPDGKAGALAAVAGAVAATDPDRAARLSADAERIAQSITHKKRKELKARALAAVARAVAATDPDRAERIAQSITISWVPDAKERVLAAVAGAVAATDPDRAARLSADAERIAQSITDTISKARSLAAVAGAVAATDPDRAARLSADAERIAQSITDTISKERVLAAVAGAVAATDPDRAERIAQSITDTISKERVLAAVAGAVAATDPDRAERIAQSITGKNGKVWALAKIAEAWNQG